MKTENRSEKQDVKVVFFDMSNRFCHNGCPYNTETACFVSLNYQDCPIDRMYQENLQYAEGVNRCAYCSNNKRNPTGPWFAQANGCDSCPGFCPACEAPKPVNP